MADRYWKIVFTKNGAEHDGYMKTDSFEGRFATLQPGFLKLASDVAKDCGFEKKDIHHIWEISKELFDNHASRKAV